MSESCHQAQPAHNAEHRVSSARRHGSSGRPRTAPRPTSRLVSCRRCCLPDQTSRVRAWNLQHRSATPPAWPDLPQSHLRRQVHLHVSWVCPPCLALALTRLCTGPPFPSQCPSSIISRFDLSRANSLATATQHHRVDCEAGVHEGSGSNCRAVRASCGPASDKFEHGRDARKRWRAEVSFQ